MTEPAERSPAARLDELAAVTKAYARFSGIWTGLTNVAAAVPLLGGVAAAWLGRERAAGWLVLLAPLVWVSVLPFARSHYQRRGVVIGAEETLPIPGWFYVGTTAAMMVVFRWWVRGPVSTAELAAQIGILGVAPTLATGFKRRFGDVSAVTYFMSAAAFPLDLGWERWFVAVTAVYAVAMGAYQHVRWGALERRISEWKRPQ